MTVFDDQMVSRLRYASFLVEPAKLLYVETPKVACTSFKLSMAALAGSDFDRLSQSLMAAKSDVLGVHDRSVVDVPSLADLHPQGMGDVLASNEYLRFCVVRNPFARIASAWVDRLLCRSVSPLAPLVEAIGFPEYSAELGFLRAQFSEFIDHLYRKETPNFTNHHWSSMTRLLMPFDLNYNLVIKLENSGPSLRALDQHVRDSGLVWPGLPRVNETPVRLGLELYTPVTARRVAEMYEDDFRDFGYSPILEIPEARPNTLPDSNYVKAIQERNQRIFYLSLKVRNMI